MSIRTIVTIVAVTMLGVSLASVGFAQEKAGASQDGIEVITIVGKRPAPAVAVICVSATAQPEGSISKNNSDGDFGDKVRESSVPALSNVRISKHCAGQFGG